MAYPGTERASYVYLDDSGKFTYMHTNNLGKPHVHAVGSWDTEDEATIMAHTMHGEWPVLSMPGAAVWWDPEWPAD